MCMKCGCGKPNDDHGNKANITYDQLSAAADAAHTDPESAADYLHDLSKKIRDKSVSV